MKPISEYHHCSIQLAGHFRAIRTVIIIIQIKCMAQALQSLLSSSYGACVHLIAVDSWNEIYTFLKCTLFLIFENLQIINKIMNFGCWSCLSGCQPCQDVEVWIFVSASVHQNHFHSQDAIQQQTTVNATICMWILQIYSLPSSNIYVPGNALVYFAFSMILNGAHVKWRISYSIMWCLFIYAFLNALASFQ